MDSRQRRKVEKRQHIHETAVQLAREKGTEAVTIEAICEAAGVSQRTFFNYFSFKEAVFVFPPPPLPDHAVARFLASEGDLAQDLTDLMVAQAEEVMAKDWQLGIMREIAETHPRLTSLQVAEFHKFEAELQRLIAKRLGTDADDIRAIALAGAVSGTGRAVTSKGRDETGDLPRIMRSALEALFQTIRG